MGGGNDEDVEVELGRIGGEEEDMKMINMLGYNFQIIK